MVTASLRVLVASAISVLGVACEDAGPKVLTWPKTSFPVAFVVGVDAAGLSVLGKAIRLEEGAVTSGLDEPLLVEGELTPVLVGFSEQVLRSLHPRIDVSAPDPFKLAPTEESCARGRRLADDAIRFKVPPRTLHFFADPTPGLEERLDQLLEASSLVTPLDETACAAARHEFGPFGETAQILPTGTVIDGQARTPDLEADLLSFFSPVGMAVVDERLIFATEAWIFSLEPGVNMGEDTPRASVLELTRSLPSPEARWLFTALAQSQEAPERIFATAVSSPYSQGGHAAVLELRAGAGPVEYVRTATVVEDRLWRLSIAPGGQLLASGDDGLLIGGDLDGSLLRGDLGFGHFAERLVPTGLDELPFVAGTANAGIYPIRWPLEPTIDTPLLLGGQRLQTALQAGDWREGPSGRELWLATFTEGLFFGDPRDAASWVRANLEIGREGLECSESQEDSCGYFAPDNPILLLRWTPSGRLIAAMRDCSSVFEIDPELRCASLVGLPPVGAGVGKSFVHSVADGAGILMAKIPGIVLRGRPR